MEQSAPAGEEILRQIRFILPKSRGRRSYRIFYIHTFPGSLRTLTISNSSISDHLSSRFSTSCTNGPRLLSRAKAGTHSAFREKSHTRAHTAKQVVFWVGVVSLPSERSARFGNSAWPGCRTANLAAFGSWPGGAPEERRKPSGQRCAHARRCPEASRPHWAALPCCRCSFSMTCWDGKT